MIYPIWYILMYSLSGNVNISNSSAFLVPEGFTLDAYRYLFKDNTVLRAYSNSFIVTLGGTLASLLLTAFTAFPLSREGLTGKKTILKFIIFTMLFHGGIIPTYLVIRSYRMVNTFWALILLDAIAVYNLLVLIRFFKNIPASLIEAAYIDGYNDIGIFFIIVLPLSKAGLAVISLFYAVSLWNSFLPGLIYLNDPSLWPIQVVLFSLVTGTTAVDENITSQITNEQAIKMATAFVAVLPILLSYPFAQKYFVKGVMLGSVKA